MIRFPMPALMALLMFGGCAQPPGVAPVDGDPTPGADDDDDLTDDDDDDDVLPPPRPESATFAAMQYGQMDESGAAAGMVRTKLDGEFQFVYWDDDQALLCRDRFSFSSEGHFGPVMVGACGACSGILSIQEVTRTSEEDLDDACVGLPPDLDLSFLLDPSAGEGVPDFRNLALVPLSLLSEMEFPIGVDGTTAEELITTYAAAGLEATYIAMVRPGGWLGTSAALGEVASGWDEVGWLPMFVVYRDADRPGNAMFLEGEIFMTSLWHVALAAGSDGASGPAPLGSSVSD